MLTFNNIDCFRQLAKKSAGYFLSLNSRRRSHTNWLRKSTNNVGFESLENRNLLAAWIAQGPSPAENGQVENVVLNDEVVGAIHTVVAHPSNADRLWIGAANGGIWRTDNATVASPTWTPQTDGQASLSIGALELDPTDGTNNTLVAGVGRFSSFGLTGGLQAGVLSTVDGGSTWANPGSAGLVGENISGVAARGTTIVAASNGFAGSFGGVFRSTNGGATFAGVAAGLPVGGDAFDLVGDPNTLTRLYVSIEQTGIFRSDDTGANWTNISAGDAALTTAITIAGNNNTEMAVANNGRLYVAVLRFGQPVYIGFSDNPAAVAPTWTEMDLPITLEGNGDFEGLNPTPKPGGQGAIHFSILADPTTATTVYVGGDRQDSPFVNAIGAGDFSGRLFRGDTTVVPVAPGSTTNAFSPQWAHLTHVQNMGFAGGGTMISSAPHADSREMTFDANGNIIEVDDGGIYRRTSRTNNTGDWFSINGNLQVSEQHDVAYDSLSDIIIAGNQDTGTTQQNVTGGTTWNSVSTADGGDVAVDDTSTPGSSFRYSSFQNLGTFRRREYNAANVLQTNTALPGIPDPQFVTPVEVNKVDGTRLAIGGFGAVHESLNQGTTNAPVAGSTGVNSFDGKPLAYGHTPDVDLIVAGDGSTVLVRPGPLATPMAQTATPYPGLFVRDVVLDPSVGGDFYVTDASTVYQTLDLGLSWSDITGNLPALTSDFRTLEYIEAAPFDLLVLGSRDGVFGSTSASNFSVWAEVGTGLPNAITFDLDYDAADDVLVAGTLGRGAWLLEDASTLNLSDAKTEFSDDAGSDLESVGGNLPQLLIEGIVAAPLTVDVDVVGGTATEGIDFTNIPATVTIPVGVYDGTLGTAIATSLSIIDDNEVEFKETIDLMLNDPSDGLVIDDVDADAITQETFTYTIKNDDSGSVVIGDVLLVVGTDNDDEVSVNRTGNGVLKVHANFGDATFDIDDVDKLYIVLRGGNDEASISKNVEVDSFVDGGPGNDHLNGGGGPTVLWGDTGIDELIAGNGGRTISIGGIGADRLVGGRDDDILIGGTTSFDNNNMACMDIAIMDILDLWDAADPYDDRVNSITPAFLLKGTTVFDDGDFDKLTGASGQDWFFFDPNEDEVTDLKDDEKVNT